MSRWISYDVLTPIRVLRRELGLTPNDLAVLSALISFLPRATPDRSGRVDEKLTVVFPSNDALSERTNGLDERTIRRCIARLADAGLIKRKTSANGKRFPLRSSGVIRDAFGFDLLPLHEQHPTLLMRANTAAEKHQEVQSLRAKALAVRAVLARQSHLNDDQMARVAAARNFLRRSNLTTDEVQQTIEEMEAILHGIDPNTSGSASTETASDPHGSHEQTDDMTAKNGQIVRHIESIHKDYKKTNPQKRNEIIDPESAHRQLNQDASRMAWTDFTHVASFYPEEPRSTESLTRTLLDIGKMLRIGQEKLSSAIKSSGMGRVLLAFNYLLAKADEIQNPSQYFDRILAS